MKKAKLLLTRDCVLLARGIAGNLGRSQKTYFKVYYAE